MSDSLFNIGAFLDAAAKANFGVVLIGGLLGGLLQPVVARLNPRAENPLSATYLQSPLLGLAAAGISVYVLADSETGDPMRLLFFALLCGLAFPAVLTSAVDTVGQRTTNVQRQAAQIANNAKAEGIDDTSRAAGQLRTLLMRNPPDSIKREGQVVIETAAQQAIQNIAQTPAATASDQRQVVEELKEVGTVARTAGWEMPAQAAADQLRLLSERIEGRAKDVAEQAAERLSDPPG